MQPARSTPAQAVAQAAAPAAGGRSAAFAAIFDHGVIRAVAETYWQQRQQGWSDARAQRAAMAAYLERRPQSSRDEAADAVKLMMVAATAPEPDRDGLAEVTQAFREAWQAGAGNAAAFEAAVDCYLRRHSGTAPLDAYGAVARILAVALERSPRWFTDGLRAPEES